ncbi:hypothetical protein PMKS-000025 [Pichia membranifaciens]|uniref:Uncharacterized protein n=1 Tax=Pichia membranifaciens TaxID=4926 RepID=A0A1Q2YAL4_9ASCO|nr:hypothetical protein PMKS-000025 [Pichia membranifaciens]
MVQIFFAKVKSVLSADTLVLTSATGTQERILSLAYLQSPRLQSNEKYAFEARELLRTLLVGKQIKFWVLYKNASNREFGDVSTPIFQSLIEFVLSKGAAKLKDNINSFDDEDVEHIRKVQKEAEIAKLGIWDPNYKRIDLVERPNASLIGSDAEKISSIVEKVLSGDRLLVRLLLSPRQHCVIPVLIAGIKTQRSSNSTEPAEEYGDEAKSYVETRLLSRSVDVQLLGESLSGALVAKIIHPNGNIADKLLEEGFAEVVDWQSSLVGVREMSVFRKEEKDARNLGKRIWKQQASASSKTNADGSDVIIGKRIEAVVARIISSDTMVLRLKDDKEITVQLISLRAPRMSDPSTAPFAQAGKEYVRQKLIGKHVDATVESVREGNEQFEERPLVTIRTSAGHNINEDIVSSGYASVIRHRRGEIKPDYWDGLIETESMAIKGKRGIHGKIPPSENLVDASENALRAKPYLFSFQSRNKITGIVDHVFSGTRFRINLPKEGVKLILVLGGLANASNRNDQFSKKALELAGKKFYQRDVTVEIYGVDKVGGFIGNIFLPSSTTPFQATLLREGLAQTHERSLADNKYGIQFKAAEDEAKEKKVGIWENYDPSSEESSPEKLAEQLKSLKIEKQYLDAEVCEVLDSGLVALHILNAEKGKLKSFMQKLHSVSATFPPVSSPKRNEVVAAKLKDNGKFYRARLLEVNKAERTVKVQHLDYGTIEVIPQSDIRILPAEFSVSNYKPQAHIAQLSLINMPPKNQEDYYKEAIYFLEDTLLDSPVVACVTFNNPTPGVEYDVELYQPEVISKDPSKSVNKEMVSQGWGLVKKKKLASFELLLSKEREELLALEEQAKSLHVGCWQFGDVEGDEEL